MMTRHRAYGLAAVAVAKALDSVSTYAMVRSGMGVEANGYSAALIDALGLAPALAARYALALATVYVIAELAVRGWEPIAPAVLNWFLPPWRDVQPDTLIGRCELAAVRLGESTGWVRWPVYATGVAVFAVAAAHNTSITLTGYGLLQPGMVLTAVDTALTAAWAPLAGLTAGGLLYVLRLAYIRWRSDRSTELA